MTLVARVLAIDRHKTRFSKIKYLQIATLRRDVEPTNRRVDREHVRTASRWCNVDGVRAGKINACDFRIALAGNQRAVVVRVNAQTMCSAASSQGNCARDFGGHRIYGHELVGRRVAHHGDPEHGTGRIEHHIARFAAEVHLFARATP